MNAPLSSHRRTYDAGAISAPAARRSTWTASQSLALSRVKRGLLRQWPLALFVSFLIAGLGIAYDRAGGLRLLPALLLWAPIGVTVGVGLGLVLEIARNRVTSVASLGKHRDYSVLGAAPELTARSLRQLAPSQRSPLGCLSFQPASPFATAFRDLQGAIADKSLVSFISSFPGEGATTAALGAAVSAAQQGRSVIIVDCDLRRQALSRQLGSNADDGVLELSEQPQSWRSFVEEEHETGLPFIPASRIRNPWRSLIGSPGFAVLIGLLREKYDLVVLDCPPALTSAEGAVIAAMADKAVVVAAWDRTPLAAVRNTMSALRRRMRGVTGVYINRVPPEYRFGRLRPD